MTANDALTPWPYQIPRQTLVAPWAKATPTAEWNAWWTAQALACRRGDRAERLAARQGFVLTRAQARTCGLSDATIRRRVRRRVWWSPRRGVLAVVAIPPADRDDHAARSLAGRRRLALECAAAALVSPGHAISGDCAAVLHGLPVLRDPEAPQLTAAAPTTMGHRGGMLVRPATLTPAQMRRWFGVPVTSVPRTLVDLARHDRLSGLMAADAALHEGLLRMSNIYRALARARGWPGIRRARRVLVLASSLAESPLESWTRLRLHDSGLPGPELQVEIAAGGPVYRVDMLWREQRVILEVDGRTKYTGDELWHEKVRQERLARSGYVVLRVMWSDIARDWPATLERIRDALAAGRTASPTL